MDGHNRNLTCIELSHDGQTLVTGQESITGVKADIIIWDLGRAMELCEAGQVMIGDDCRIRKLLQHVGKVQALAFSMDDSYLATLGGQDDNALVIWNVSNGTAICGAPASQDSAFCVKWLNNRNDRLVTAGIGHLRVWQVDFGFPKMHPMDAKFGSLRRTITCMSIEPDDHFAYCGTETGDMVKLKIDRNEFKSFNDPDTLVPSVSAVTKLRFPQGIVCISCVVNHSTGNYNILVGGGDGTLTFINQNLRAVADRSTKLLGGVTSFVMHPNGQSIMVGTAQCNFYQVSMDFKKINMLLSCHQGEVFQVCFPAGCSDIVVTSSKEDIRIWNVNAKKELLRIQVKNLDCKACSVSPSGGLIVSGWSDGKIRAFLPESGKMKFLIPDAHQGMCTALALADDDNYAPWRIISGGADGRVRIWNITSQHQAMISSLKEHRGAVNSIKVDKNFTQAISASADGSCIVWDLARSVRIMAFFEPNVFMDVLYHPDESQMLTCGTNHKITYWDAVDGQAIRELDCGDAFLTALDIEPEGEFFISGSDDKLLRVWHYDEGLPVGIGKGHSGTVNACAISPDMSTIASVSSTGEIMFWDMPSFQDMRGNMDDEQHK